MRVTKISSVLLGLLSKKYLNLHSLKLNTMCSQNDEGHILMARELLDF